MRELITEYERSNGYGVRSEDGRRGKTYYQVSPKNIIKRAEHDARPTLPPRKCWHCGKPFTPSTPFIRYCGQACRHWHLFATDPGDLRGGNNRRKYWICEGMGILNGAEKEEKRYARD